MIAFGRLGKGFCGNTQTISNVLQRDPDITNVILLGDKPERNLREEVKNTQLNKTSTISSRRSGKEVNMKILRG